MIVLKENALLIRRAAGGKVCNESERADPRHPSGRGYGRNIVLTRFLF
jgi:hypothetical protein